MTAQRIESPSAYAVRDALPSAHRRPTGSHDVAASSRGLRYTNFAPMQSYPPAWLSEVGNRVSELMRAGHIVSDDALEIMGMILADPIFDGTPRPLLSPGDDHGLSAEFQAADIDLQIDVSGGGAVEVYALQRGVFEWEGPLDELPDGIEKWAWRLVQSAL